MFCALSLRSLLAWASAALCEAMDQIESFYVPADMDTGGSRFFHRAVRCPFHEECSRHSWSKARIVSFISEEAARKGVYEHLVTSGRHWKREAEAKTAAAECEIEIVEETEAEREQYRKQIDGIEDRKRQRDDSPDRRSKSDDENKSKGKSKGKKGKTRSSRGGRAEATSSSASSAAAQAADHEAQIVARQPTQVNSQNLGMLIDCLDRSKAALESSQVMFQRAAEAFQQRSQACVETSIQLQRELNALSAARDCVRDLQSRLQRG